MKRFPQTLTTMLKHAGIDEKSLSREERALASKIWKAAAKDHAEIESKLFMDRFKAMTTLSRVKKALKEVDA